jgi:glycosyltransferase involved in cell wall biosynthesis
MKPFISIITPVLNNEQFISQAIENYLSESTLETELIIVDGGSKDRTVEIIQSFANERQDIKMLCIPAFI